jgi:hypothetical protein
MAEYDNTNRGTMSRNRRKELDTHPDFAGSINIEGVEYWLNGWVKDGKNGKFFSLSVRPKDAERKPAAKLEDTADYFGDSSDIPF